MRRALLIIAGLLAAPIPCAAGTVGAAASVGSGASFDDGAARIPTNVMLAPGVGLLSDTLRVELGLIAELERFEDAGLQTRFGLRPMVVVMPPVVPLHARLMTSIQDLGDTNQLSLGAAGGVHLGAGPVSAFAEVGYLPRITGGFTSVVEGRLGAGVAF